MQHAVLLGRDTLLRSTAAPTALCHFGRLTNAFDWLELVHHVLRGMSVYAIDPAASGGAYRLRYGGAAGVTLSNDPQLLAVHFTRSDAPPSSPPSSHRTLTYQHEAPARPTLG